MTVTSVTSVTSITSIANPIARLGTWSYRRRRLVGAAWLGALIFFTLIGRSAGSQFRDSISGGPTESQRAASFLAGRFPAQAGDATEVVFSSRADITSAPVRARIDSALAAVVTVPHVRALAGPFGPSDAGQVSADAHVAYAVVQFDRAGDAVPDGAIRQVIDRARSGAGPGLTVALTGAPIEKVEKPKFGASEALGILAAMVILLLAFGSAIAMALPIACAIVAVAATLGILDVLSHGLTVPSFGPELAALVGLGVGIDYALFVVTRYRASLRAGAGPEAAVATAMATSGRAVLFAGTTVVLSLLGLLLLGLPFIYGASLGAVTAVLMVMAASLTLLPAGLGFVGANIDRLNVGVGRRGSGRGDGRTFWWRWSRRVQKRPRLAGGSALLILLVLAVPFLALRLSFTDAGTDPTSYTSRQAYDALARGFGPGSSGPLILAAELRAGSQPDVLGQLARRLSALPGVVSVSPPQFSPDGTAAVLRVVPRTAPQDAGTATLVRQIRHSVVPRATAGTGVTVLVGGTTAASIDTTGVISRHLGLVVSVVILLSVLLLMAAFRSVVIPVAGALMTLLSTGAAYGVIVAVFQWGWLGSGVDNGATAPVDPWVPVMLFALLFGLSTDYQVFLVSRIRERWRAGESSSDAVAGGLAQTGRVITSAAAIMICVFAAFVLGDLRILRLFGFAMAVAILLDATLVRMVLMPATLQLLGRANWWFPGGLGRRFPRLTVEPGADERAVGVGR